MRPWFFVAALFGSTFALAANPQPLDAPPGRLDIRPGELDPLPPQGLMPPGFQRHVFGGPTLGVETQELNPELRQFFNAPDDRGVLVARIMPDSAAEHAGLVVGDVITKVAGEAARDTAAIRRALSAHPGDTIKITVIRERKRLNLSATLDAPDADAENYDFDNGNGNVEIYRWHGQLPEAFGGLLDELEDRSWDEFRDPLFEQLDKIQQHLDTLDQRMDALSGQDSASE